ncbi:hypothetical protein [Shewanella sp. YLB-07]|uniref:hypothetical protein n=1 Tax=Shewanella sp. YLB-07 TaxID=2601268 RepID=UPI00128D0BD8|nr:hypothetical protein [Shewanella sp. YLB-07]MPY24560.1 hypothetical protein [Shewanella sp. YLB-07]
MKACLRFGLPAMQISNDDIALLQAQYWQGNIREFATVIDRAALLGHAHQLDVKGALGHGVMQHVLPALPTIRSRSAVAETWSLASAMRLHIAKGLQYCDGNSIELSRLAHQPCVTAPATKTHCECLLIIQQDGFDSLLADFYLEAVRQSMPAWCVVLPDRWLLITVLPITTFRCGW